MNVYDTCITKQRVFDVTRFANDIVMQLYYPNIIPSELLKNIIIILYVPNNKTEKNVCFKFTSY